ncbi:TPA: hypothetical protein ACTY4T_001010 [Enterobacter hormaechei]
MDESRKQFLEWWRQPEQQELRKSCAEGWGEKIWSSSRSAIEIKLDDKVMVEDEFDKGHNCAIDYCAEAIRAAGIKVKE